MKSICFVVSSPFTANAFLLEHIKQLSKFFTITLCLNLQLYPLSCDFDVEKIRIVNIPLERKIHLLKDAEALFRLFMLFRTEQFDVVHTVSPKAGLLGMLAAFIAQIKNRFHTFTGQVWANAKGVPRKFYKLIDKLICHLATEVFADSQSQINYLVAQGICKTETISMLGVGSISGVNLGRFKPDFKVRSKYRKLMGAVEKDIVFLFVGRLCADKGVNDLLLAFKKNYPHFKKRGFLWLVGPDEAGMEALLKPVFPELQKQVKWIGPSFEPEKYMAAADILVLPSYREGFGNVVIEAAACKIPSIAYQIDGIVDAISDGCTGLLVPKYDINSLSDQMYLLAIDSELRQTLGNNAHERASMYFSSQIVTANWLSFYKKLLIR